MEKKDNPQGLQEWLKKLDGSISVIQNGQEELKRGQEALKRSVDSKLDKLRTELRQDIETKIKAFKQDMDIEIEQITSTYERLSVEVTRLKLLMNNETEKRTVITAEGPANSKVPIVTCQKTLTH